MTFVELLTDLARTGVRLEAHADRLRFHPRDQATPALVAGLTAHKSALLAALAEPTGPCPRCGSVVLVRLVSGPTVCSGCCPVKSEAVAGTLVWNDDRGEIEPYAEAQRSAGGSGPLSRGPELPQCPRCGDTNSRDVPIHNGQSVRRDCAGCGRFLDFTIWYGRKKEASIA